MANASPQRNAWTDSVYNLLRKTCNICGVVFFYRAFSQFKVLFLIE